MYHTREHEQLIQNFGPNISMGETTLKI